MLVSKRTPFYEQHLAQQAKIVDFAGWEMPLHYGSQIKEHNAVRQNAGMFDVSHMGIVDIKGERVMPYLRMLLANNVDKLTPGKALYTCMLNEHGGVIDDLIVYKKADDSFRVIVNAGTREKDLHWMQKKGSPYKVDIIERKDLAMLALQGPKAVEKIASILTGAQFELVRSLKPFHFVQLPETELFIARTGYTGEDGFELMFPAVASEQRWQSLLKAGVQPCGLGARDTLRLEAGLNLYGHEMDEKINPLQANLAWTVALLPQDREFTGKEAILKQQQEGVREHLVGLVLEGPGIIRDHQKVYISDDDLHEGYVTSGGYSPTLAKSIALARLPLLDDNVNNAPLECFVEIRNKRIKARVIKPPFVRHGKKCFV